MTDSHKSISALSPEKLELLATLLQEEGSTYNTFPLSYAQERLWFLEQMEPGSAIYNISAAGRLTGELNEEALKESLNEIVRRHESLRTRFESINGNPVQVVEGEMRIEMPVVDLRGMGKRKGREEAKKLAGEVAGRSFELERGPLIRARMMRVGEEERVLVVSMHHIISDGWSIGVMLEEVRRLYESYSKGEESELEEMEVQYSDYVVWQRERVRGEVLEEQMRYWKEQLKGAPAVMELGTDRARPGKQSKRGETKRFRIRGEEVERLRGLSRREGITMYMLLLAGFKVLMYRYSGEGDIVVGTPVAGRGQMELERSVGFFVNTIAVRTKLREEMRVGELLRVVREEVLEGQAHQEVPFEKVVEELEPERVMSHQPIVQVMFTMNSGVKREVRLGGVRMELEELDSGTSKFDLTMGIGDEGGELRGWVEYSTDLWEAGSIERMIGHYEEILGEMGEEGKKIRDVEMMNERERRELIEEWNDTRREYPREKRVEEMFDREAEGEEEAVAVECEGRSVSYGELKKRSNRIGRYLRREGVGEEEMVGVCMERSERLVEVLLGVMKAGGAYVPLDGGYPEERLRKMVEDAGLRVIVSEGEAGEALKGMGARVIRVDEEGEEIERESGEEMERVGDAESIAYVMYTSGSTGIPKGVSITHRGIARLVKGSEYAEMNRAEVFLLLSPVTFDASTFEMWGSLLNGAKLAAMGGQRYTLSELGEALQRYEVTTVWLTAGLFHMMVDERIEDLRNVRQLLAGGDVLSVSHVQRVLSEIPGCKVINGYGPTESTTFACCYGMKGNEQIGNTVPIGRAIANTEVYIVDKQERVVPMGIVGELYIGGDGLARNYYKRAELTAERFVPDPYGKEDGGRLYRTGDQVRYRPEGYIEFIGRNDNQVKIRGFRIELGEVEAALIQHPAVKEALVLTRENTDADKRLIAYVVREHDVSPSVLVSQLREHLRGMLPDYMLPSMIEIIETFPLTDNGKVDRRALPIPEHTGSQNEESFVSPRTSVEEILASIWAEALGVDQVGVEDNFFDLGGHSLLAIRLVSRVKSALGVDLPLRELFESPNLAALAQCIEKTMNAGLSVETPPIAPVSHERQRVLSYAQERLWFLEQMEPGSAIYNISAAGRLTGELNEEALKESLNEIVRRHESLRTRFESINGNPVQVVEGEMRIEMPVVDLRGMGKRKGREEAKKLAGEVAGRSFELERGPLIRARMMRVGEEERVLVVSMHHIISDGWSIGVMLEEVRRLYESYSKGEESELEEMEVQYSDYVVWQRERVRGEVLEEQMRYWKEQLKGAPAVMELGTDRARPGKQSKRGETKRFRIRGEEVERLRGLSRREGITMYMLLLAGFKVLMYRYSGEGDIVVGTPVAGRGQMELERSVGFFVNTIAVRTKLREEMRVGELLRVVREEVLEGQAHQEVPFEKVVEELEPERVMSHQPIVQVMFTMNSGVKREVRLGGVRMELEELDSGTSKFDLTMGIGDEGGELRGWVEYSTDLWEAGSIERMIGHYEEILGEMGEEGKKIRDVEMMNERERRELIEEWNDTRREYPREKRVEEMFDREAEGEEEAVAVECEGRSVSYGELKKRSNRIGRYLRREGVGEEEMVGVCMERSERLVEVLLGVMKAGGAYVPLDGGYPEERLRKMVEDAGLRVIVSEGEAGEALKGMGARVIRVDEEGEEIERESEEEMERVGDAESIAYVMYTSGSTGIPKGVSITHRGIARLVKGSEYAEMNRGEVFLLLSPVTFDLSTFEAWGSLLNGAKLAVMGQRYTLSELGEALQRYEVTTVWLTAGLFHMMVDERIEDLRNVRQLLAGGDVLSVSHVQRVLSEIPGCKVINGYGPTESTTFACCYGMKGNEQIGNTVPIGRAIANTEVYIVDKQERVVPMGIVGELYIGGDGLARNYYKRAELTAERFVPDPYGKEDGGRLYRTGDQVRYRPEGYIEFIGRNDNQVKIRGFRIELGEVETVLSEYPSAKEVIVLARRDTPGEKRLVAYIASEDQESTNVDELRRFAKEKLPDYMVPSAFVVLDAFPLTPNGKVDRRALPAPHPSDTLRDEESAALRTPTEELLAGIWSKILGVERVCANDNFFDLGGHSLLAMLVVSEVCEVFRIEVPVRALFEEPTLTQFAATIEEAIRAENMPQLPPINRVSRDEVLPLAFAQQRLWFLNQLRPDSASYSMPSAIRLSGQFNPAALQQALSEIIRRHEVLRTVFTSASGRPLQRIVAAEPIPVPIINLEGLPASVCEAEQTRLITEESQHPFDLTYNLPIRARLLRLAPDQHVALVTMHHIASDAWSVGIFVQEIGVLYEGFSSGTPSPLSELATQYADFAAWQRQCLQGEVLATEVAYWKRQLAGMPEKSNLPTDRARSSAPSYRGAYEAVVLPLSLTDSLKALSRQEGVTLFMVLLAAFQVLLNRYTTREDIVVGSAIAGRNRAEIERLIGYFVNMLVLRTDLSGNPRFRDLLARVREVTLAAYAHQDVPFETLVEELQPSRELSHSPLFQVAFGLNNVPRHRRDTAFQGLTLASLPVNYDAVRYDLTVWMSEQPEGLGALWSYSTELFERSTIIRMLQHYENLLRSIVAEPDARLSELEMISDEEIKLKAIREVELKEASARSLISTRRKAISIGQSESLQTGDGEK